MSGGEQQMLAIARAMMAEAEDDPARRTVRRHHADPRRRAVRAVRPDEGIGHHDPAGRAERRARAVGSRTGPTSSTRARSSTKAPARRCWRTATSRNATARSDAIASSAVKNLYCGYSTANCARRLEHVLVRGHGHAFEADHLEVAVGVEVVAMGGDLDAVEATICGVSAAVTVSSERVSAAATAAPKIKARRLVFMVVSFVCSGVVATGLVWTVGSRLRERQRQATDRRNHGMNCRLADRSVDDRTSRPVPVTGLATVCGCRR